MDQSEINKHLLNAIFALSKATLLAFPPDTEPEKQNKFQEHFKDYLKNIQLAAGVPIERIDNNGD